MPSFTTSTVLRDHTDALDIDLHVRYEFIIGEPSSVVFTVKNGVPRDVDVILQSDLVLSLSGTFNRTVHGGRSMQSSAIAQHLLEYFHAVGDSLGVRASSKVFLEEEDGTAKLTLSPTRSFLERRSPYIRLSAVDLLYVCTTPPRTPDIPDNSGIADPFAPSILLPVVSVLDRLLEQFVLHSIRRYPLIFGPWRKRFDGEIATVSKLSLAVVDIIRRSPHTAFRKRSRRIIQALNSTDVDANVALEHLLQAVLGNTADEDPVQTKCVLAEPKGDFYNLDYADTLSRALERIYKAMPRSSRRRDLCSIFPDKGYRRTADKDDFALSDCPDLPRSDEVLENDQSSDIRLYPLAKPDLWLDEDAETLGGSQEGGDPITHDDASLVNDIDIWVSDEAESLAYAPLESSDDFWDSSQSTTLDDPMLDWEDPPAFDSSRASYTTGQDSAFSDPYPRVVISKSLSDAMLNVEDDEWLEDLAHSTDQISNNLNDQVFLSQRAASRLSEAVTVFCDLDLAHNLRSSPRLSTSSCSTPSYLPSQIQTQGFGPPFHEAPGDTTSHFHMLLDDDLEPQEAGSSGTYPVARSQDTTGTGPDLSCVEII